jgi:hypothetical protein
MVLKRCLFLIAGNKLSCVSNDDDLNSIKNQFLLLAYGANRHIKLEEPKPYQEFDAIATLFGENGYLKHIRVSSTFEYVNKHFKTIQPLINAVLETSEHNNNVFFAGAGLQPAPSRFKRFGRGCKPRPAKIQLLRAHGLLNVTSRKANRLRLHYEVRHSLALIFLPEQVCNLLRHVLTFPTGISTGGENFPVQQRNV